MSVDACLPMKRSIGVISARMEVQGEAVFLSLGLDGIRVFPAPEKVQVDVAEDFFVLRQKVHELSVSFAPYHFAEVVSPLGKLGLVAVRLGESPPNAQKLRVYPVHIAHRRSWTVLCRG